ncbi:DUF418 domain-containing protein [Cytophagaceae bacterium DM2B3-1]|uniref:DUF418 domain-containing protein n=1 Tax=Xanthocytophaga flava TaxID=3048013 RepID=A0ABT7CW25_9BACT|nr:DUF418 domain-containing protein [Xanthocytophaga flavus]MDJ1466414.1 DUF418 domain-containing protein [Xanthocytophaga flavus]MDJ1497920.1 DUF418 domain-containing protein [Xanthocytophaga flavus]
MTTTTETLPQTLTVESAANRLQVVDSLRGFALLGILIAHIVSWFDGGPLPGSIYQKAFENIPVWQQILNGITQFISEVLVRGKFFSFFSFLFGLSFALQLFSFEKKSGNFLGRYAWRLVILGLIGLAHSLHWRGDILSIYAPLGFLLLLFRKLPDKIILTIAILLVINIPTRLTAIYQQYLPQLSKAQQEQQNKQSEKDTEQYYQIMMHGSYVDNLKANFKALEMKKNFQIESGRIYITFGFFLLGLYAGRKKIFEQFPVNKLFFKKILQYSGFIALGLLIAGICLGVMYNNNPQPPPAILFIFMTIYDSFNALLTLFYIAGITLLFAKPVWNSRLLHFAPVGKMALTSYVSQTVIGLLLFYGYCGLGLVGIIPPWICFLLSAPIFLLQMQFSKWWLSRFKYGPLEWIWRSATYLRWQPIRL